MKEKAIKLRQQGVSINEISNLLEVSKSTVSLWVKSINLSTKARKVLDRKIAAARIKSKESKKIQRIGKEQDAVKFAKDLISGIKLDSSLKKLLCSLIHYCEGNKSIREGVVFTNSDPVLVKIFLALFRSSFDLNEKKFRICVHLHKYHEVNKQLNFWSKTARIPLSQFIKPYLKKNTGLYKKDNYQGCVSIRYADTQLARKISAIVKEFAISGPIVQWQNTGLQIR